ncbi:DNA-binding transcriptional activator BglJ [Serratia quinivorans]|uniref:LuxR family transcriptional regulator n=1 Tax=Serratia TaxID=613 RepID=UPI00035CCF0F|nr:MULTISPECIES: helix-turn-helix transcriptional regulator [Serratia]CAI1895662.1 DNA-binding transcriptional activator BglJ [Serratia quinivorans]
MSQQTSLIQQPETHNDRASLNAPVTAVMLPPPLAELLTPKELHILQAVLNGQDLTTLAWRLNRNIRTVSNHKQRAMDKLGLTSNAMLYALGALLSPPLPEGCVQRMHLLTPREHRVLAGLLQGKTVGGIAREQHKSIKTISLQKQRLMEKLALCSGVDLFRFAPDRARVLLANWSAWPDKPGQQQPSV